MFFSLHEVLYRILEPIYQWLLIRILTCYDTSKKQ